MDVTKHFSLLFKQLPIVKCSFRIRFPDKEWGWDHCQHLTGGQDSFELLSEQADAWDSWILRSCWIGSSRARIRMDVNRRNVCKTHNFYKNWMKHRDVLAPRKFMNWPRVKHSACDISVCNHSKHKGMSVREKKWPRPSSAFHQDVESVSRPLGDFPSKWNVAEGILCKH